MEHGEGPAKQRFAQLSIVIVRIIHAIDVRDGLVCCGNGGVMGFPELVRRFGVSHFVDVFPVIRLLLEPVERTPVAVELIISVV